MGSQDAIFFADTSPGVMDEVRRPLSERPSGDSKSLIMETMYVPASAYTANFLQAWAVKMLERQQRQAKAPVAAAATAAAESKKMLPICLPINITIATRRSLRALALVTLSLFLAELASSAELCAGSQGNQGFCQLIVSGLLGY